MYFQLSVIVALFATSCTYSAESYIPVSDSENNSAPLNECRSINDARFSLQSELGDFSNQPESGYVQNPDDYFEITPGGGLIVADFNGDDLLDLYLSRLDKDLLYFNEGDRSFTLMADMTSDHDFNSPSIGGSAADFDGDGDMDIFLLTARDHNRLLMNNGHGFTDVTEQYGLLDDIGDSTAAVWNDFDLDGDLDLFVGGHKEAAFNLNPDGVSPAATINRLYQNNGDSFDPVALYEEAVEPYTYAAAWLQPEEGKRPLLYVVNDFGDMVVPNMLYSQESQGFAPVQNSGLDLAMAGMGISQTDLNSDGLPDLLISDFEGVRLLMSSQSNQWYESSQSLGLTRSDSEQIYSWGVNLFDFENDGRPDAFASWGPTHNLSGELHEEDSMHQPNSFWANLGGEFQDMAHVWGVEARTISRGSVVADLDLDGVQDLILSHVNAPAEIYWGDCMNGNWVSLEIDMDGMNTNGVGSKVVVKTQRTEQTQWILAGDSLASGGPPIAHFGLGHIEEDFVEVEITLPDGRKVQDTLTLNAHSKIPIDG